MTTSNAFTTRESYDANDKSKTNTSHSFTWLSKGEEELQEDMEEEVGTISSEQHHHPSPNRFMFHLNFQYSEKKA